jgi:serine/threonine protein kinase
VESRLVLPTNAVLSASYRILRVVGTGGFGITYEAEDINLGTMVAIKEYYPVEFGELPAGSAHAGALRACFDRARHARVRGP